ncbi:MAG: ferrochelatase [Elusimicrobia bacterium]|nr:ferrochelatase [Elusimicrobiota bacterium]
METVGILLMAYGAAQSLEEIEPYLKDIRGGRPTSPELVEEVKERYRRMGGKSPLLQITQQQAQTLQTTLYSQLSTLNSTGFEVFIGMRHWHPYIQNTIGEIKKQGIKKLVALCLTPFYSKMSVGAYFGKLDEAIKIHRIKLELIPIHSYHDHPLLLDAYAEKLKQTLERLTTPVKIIFSAHSLPQKILQEKDPYPEQILETARAIIQKIEGEGAIPWSFAYQSQGRTPEPWLGPDVGEVIEQLVREGCRHVVSAPIGFISDHMETLYDNDILYKNLAQSKGISFTRVPSLNASPLFIQCLADLVLSKLRVHTA